MTKEAYFEAIENSGEGLTCPFLQTDDHYEIQNNSQFFDKNGDEYSLKAEIEQKIKNSDYNIVIFLDESGDFPVDECSQVIIEATTPNIGG